MTALSLFVIEPSYLETEVARYNAGRPRQNPFQTEALVQKLGGGLTLVNVAGPLLKSPGWWDFFGGATSLAELATAINGVANDSETRGVILRVDSPGGTVAGTVEAADAVAALNRRVPTVAFVNDLCASGAYWIASQARAMFAGRTSLIGSIGTFMRITDMSGMAESLGVKVHVVRSPQDSLKGTGVPGTKVTDAQLAGLQAIIDDTQTHFAAAVAAGRRMSESQVAGIADGTVHIAAKAQAKGLIDGVCSFEEAVSKLRGMAGSQAPRTAAASAPREPKPIADYELVLKNLMASGHSRQSAAAYITREMPEIHDRYHHARHAQKNAGKI